MKKETEQRKLEKMAYEEKMKKLKEEKKRKKEAALKMEYEKKERKEKKRLLQERWAMARWVTQYIDENSERWEKEKTERKLTDEKRAAQWHRSNRFEKIRMIKEKAEENQVVEVRLAAPRILLAPSDDHHPDDQAGSPLDDHGSDDQVVHLDAPDSAVLHHPDQEKCSSRPKIIQSPTITGAVGRCDEFHDTNNKLPILTSFLSGTYSKPCQGQAEQDPARDRADDHQPGQVDEPLEDQGHDVPDQASAGSDHPDQQHDQEGPHQAQDSAGERTMDQADDHQPAPDGLTLHHPDQEKCSSMPQYIIQSPTITGAVGRCDEFHNNHINVPILTSFPPGTPTILHPGIADIDETNSEEARAEPWPSLGHDQAVKDTPSQAEHLHHPDQEICSSMPQYIIQSPTITGAVGRCD